MSATGTAGAQSLGGLFYWLGIDTGPLTAGVAKARTLMTSLGISSQTLAAGGVAGLGIAFAVAGVKAVKMAAEFETALAEVETIAGKTHEEVVELGRALEAMSTTSPHSAIDTVRGFYQTLSSGVTDTTDALQLMAVASKLATGQLVSQEIAVDGMTTALNAYDMGIDQAWRVSDVFAKTVDLAKTRLGPLAAHIGTVIPLAANMGVEFEDLSAAIATLTQGGVPLEIALTSLRSMMNQVLQADEDQIKAAKALGLEWGKEQVKAKGLIGVMTELNEASKTNGEIIQTLFPDVRGLIGVMSLAGNMTERFQENLDALNDSMGTTSDKAGVMEDVLSARFTILGNNLSRIMRNMGDEIGAFLKIGDVIDKINESLDDTFVKRMAARSEELVNLGLITREELDRIREEAAKPPPTPAGGGGGGVTIGGEMVIPGFSTAAADASDDFEEAAKAITMSARATSGELDTFFDSMGEEMKVALAAIQPGSKEAEQALKDLRVSMAPFFEVIPGLRDEFEGLAQDMGLLPRDLERLSKETWEMINNLTVAPAPAEDVWKPYKEATARAAEEVREKSQAELDAWLSHLGIGQKIGLDKWEAFYDSRTDGDQEALDASLKAFRRGEQVKTRLAERAARTRERKMRKDELRKVLLVFEADAGGAVDAAGVLSSSLHVLAEGMLEGSAAAEVLDAALSAASTAARAAAAVEGAGFSDMMSGALTGGLYGAVAGLAGSVIGKLFGGGDDDDRSAEEIRDDQLQAALDLKIAARQMKDATDALIEEFRGKSGLSAREKLDEVEGITAAYEKLHEEERKNVDLQTRAGKLRSRAHQASHRADALRLEASMAWDDSEKRRLEAEARQWDVEERQLNNEASALEALAKVARGTMDEITVEIRDGLTALGYEWENFTEGELTALLDKLRDEFETLFDFPDDFSGALERWRWNMELLDEVDPGEKAKALVKEIQKFVGITIPDFDLETSEGIDALVAWLTETALDPEKVGEFEMTREQFEEIRGILDGLGDDIDNGLQSIGGADDVAFSHATRITEIQSNMLQAALDTGLTLDRERNTLLQSLLDAGGGGGGGGGGGLTVEGDINVTVGGGDGTDIDAIVEEVTQLVLEELTAGGGGLPGG